MAEHEYVVTREWGDHNVGDVLPVHPGDDHAHRVVRRVVVPLEPVESHAEPPAGA